MLIKHIVQISNDLCKSHTGEVKKSQCTVYGACVLSRFSCAQLFATLWIVACQAPLSIGFSRQEYWSGLPYPPPGDIFNPGIEPVSLTSLHWQVGSLPLAQPEKSQRIWYLSPKSGKLVILNRKIRNDH